MVSIEEAFLSGEICPEINDGINLNPSCKEHDPSLDISLRDPFNRTMTLHSSID